MYLRVGEELYTAGRLESEREFYRELFNPALHEERNREARDDYRANLRRFRELAESVSSDALERIDSRCAPHRRSVVGGLEPLEEE